MKLYSHEGDKLPENRMFHHTVAMSSTTCDFWWPFGALLAWSSSRSWRTVACSRRSSSLFKLWHFGTTSASSNSLKVFCWIKCQSAKAVLVSKNLAAHPAAVCWCGRASQHFRRCPGLNPHLSLPLPHHLATSAQEFSDWPWNDELKVATQISVGTFTSPNQQRKWPKGQCLLYVIKNQELQLWNSTPGRSTLGKFRMEAQIREV